MIYGRMRNCVCRTGVHEHVAGFCSLGLGIPFRHLLVEDKQPRLPSPFLMYLWIDGLWPSDSGKQI